MRCSAPTLILIMALAGSAGATAASSGGGDLDALHQGIDRLADQVEPHVIANRRYIHQHPELSNRETETAAYIAEHLQGAGH